MCCVSCVIPVFAFWLHSDTTLKGKLQVPEGLWNEKKSFLARVTINHFHFLYCVHLSSCGWHGAVKSCWLNHIICQKQNCGRSCNWNCQSSHYACNRLLRWKHICPSNVCIGTLKEQTQSFIHVPTTVTPGMDTTGDTNAFIFFPKLMLHVVYFVCDFRLLLKQIQHTKIRKKSGTDISLLPPERTSAKPQTNLQTRSKCLMQPFVESTRHNKWTLNCFIPAVRTLKAHSWWLWIPARHSPSLSICSGPALAEFELLE